jgi:hypothetical protein
MNVHFRIRHSYVNLIGIDSAFSLTTLTSGLALRYNPINLNHKEKITHNLDDLKSKGSLIAIMGSELTDTYVNSNTRPRSALMSASRRVGHSFSLIDIVYSTEKKTSFLRLRNSQTSMRLVDPNQESLGEFIGLDKKKTDSEKQNGVFYVKREDMFKYFEILTLLVMPDPRDDSNFIKKNFLEGFYLIFLNFARFTQHKRSVL